MKIKIQSFTLAQMQSFEKFISFLKRKKLLRAILHYRNGEVWLYTKPEAYNHVGAWACKKEYNKLVKYNGQAIMRGHDYHPLNYGRRIGKAIIQRIAP